MLLPFSLARKVRKQASLIARVLSKESPHGNHFYQDDKIEIDLMDERAFYGTCRVKVKVSEEKHTTVLLVAGDGLSSTLLFLDQIVFRKGLWIQYLDALYQKAKDREAFLKKSQSEADIYAWRENFADIDDSSIFPEFAREPL